MASNTLRGMSWSCSIHGTLQVQLVLHLALFNSPHILTYLDPKFSDRRKIEVTRKHWLGIKMCLKSLFVGSTLAFLNRSLRSLEKQILEKNYLCQLYKQKGFVRYKPMRSFAIAKPVWHSELPKVHWYKETISVWKL